MNKDNDYSYVKLFRKMFDWEWYTNVCTCKLFIHLLLKANHSNQKWQGEVIKKGTFITSINKLSIETGLTIQQVRTALKNLKKTNDIDVKSTNKNTLITIVNYGFYQGMQVKPNKQITNEQQTNNNQITTNNNDNNDNNDNNENNNTLLNKRFVPPSLEEVTAYCKERNNNVDPNSFIDFYQSKNWMVGKNKMIDWKACIRTWENRRKKKNKEKSSFTEKQNEIIDSWKKEEQFEPASEKKIEEFKKMLEEL